MKVRKLISELKKMPQNLEVGVGMHDNNENEIAGWVFSVEDIIECCPAEGYNKDKWEGKRCISIRC